MVRSGSEVSHIVLENSLLVERRVDILAQIDIARTSSPITVRHGRCGRHYEGRLRNGLASEGRCSGETNIAEMPRGRLDYDIRECLRDI